MAEKLGKARLKWVNALALWEDAKEKKCEKDLKNALDNLNRAEIEYLEVKKEVVKNG